MNIEQAKAIAMSAIFEALNIRPSKENETNAYYLSPFRNEKTASLHVNKVKNVWFDHGEGKGGNCVDFACAYLKAYGNDCTVSDALRWLGNMVVATPKPLVTICHEKKQASWEVISSKTIKDLALIRYLENRGIALNLAKKYLTEMYVKHSESKAGMIALAFKNEEGGYELRNPFFKGCVAPKDITFIRGTQPKPPGIHLFEGFLDYLTFLTTREGNNHLDDAIVLNSNSNIARAIPYIAKYGYQYLYSWLDNDNSGIKASNAICDFAKTEVGLEFKAMNEVYKPHNDLNAWHMYNLNLKL